MKKLLALSIVLLFSFTSKAQENIWNRNRISPSLIENFETTKTNKKLKIGECFIINSNNRELARGHFRNGQKDSIWNFFSQNGDLIQVYDYTNKVLKYNIPDEGTIVKERFVVDTTGLVKPKVTSPVKIGGVNYGFYLLYNERSIPSAAKDQKEQVLMEYVFDISETGKMEKFSINYISPIYNSENPQSIKGYHPDAYEFVPATVNGKAVKSKVIYQIMLYINQNRDRGTYNVPTQKNG